VERADHQVTRIGRDGGDVSDAEVVLQAKSLADGGLAAGYVPTVQDMTTALLTEGDLDRGQPPNLTRPHWRSGIVHAATGAVCTRRPHRSHELHHGYQAVQGTGPPHRWSAQLHR
jgi:hypothetical protein